MLEWRLVGAIDVSGHSSPQPCPGAKMVSPESFSPQSLIVSPKLAPAASPAKLVAVSVLPALRAILTTSACDTHMLIPAISAIQVERNLIKVTKLKIKSQNLSQLIENNIPKFDA